MRHSDRDRRILELLWRCGAATALQLTHQIWDRGKDNSRFRDRLKQLVDNGFIRLLPFPREAACLSLGLPRHCYVLTWRGAQALDQPLPPDSETAIREHLLKSEIVRQLALRGYGLLSSEGLHEAGLDAHLGALYCSAELNQVLVLWCPENSTRPAHAVLRRVQESTLDRFTVSVMFTFTQVTPFLAFKEHISTASFERQCPFECLAVLAREPLVLGQIREAVPFEGWRHLYPDLVVAADA
ncbi:winged helix-turn-helix domain-containing protein [Gloeobacter morelensis]|uniref:Winged helix-turn-helix domain-containing protein n=1 Tax=Gloeobacter morelensis MG652769 TaxID=2781736 RepID=A0ABY3PG04_9CYAN|nr:winged helix-turn-helix domain-containing protein [Gloeobacter morelensis]UFP92590.1 winged helix-turn-helix domain-containing protein [Gloeobacter morelensis MG652769]